MNSFPTPPQRSSKGTVTAFMLFLGGAVFSTIIYFSLPYFTKPPVTPRGYMVERIGGLKNIKPVLSVERRVEAPYFMPLKEKLNSLIETLKKQGDVNDVSVYLAEFDHYDWMSINTGERYHPASLMKVAMLICYLRMAESNPGLLEKELLFEQPPAGKISEQYYKGLSIEPGKKYQIQQLLTYMIAYSDNNATWVLSQYFDPQLLRKLFVDLGLDPPVADEASFTMTAKDYTTFFDAIYNSSYLTPEYSDYAAELLKNCSFGDGFVKGIGLDRDSLMWHKFGEWRLAGHDFELHESGVIHVKGKPYLLTIMTRGKNTPNLAKSISLLSQTVYESLATP